MRSVVRRSPAGDTYTCTFTLVVSGNAGEVVDDTVVATVVDNDGTTATDDDDASVEITDVPPTIEVTKDDGGASVAAPGGPVEYTVDVTNTSFEAVTVTSITDSIDGGDPFDVTTPATDPVLETTCATGVEIPAGETYTCTFTVLVSGDGGELVEDTVVVAVVDDDDTPTDGTDDETTPVTPVVDLAVVKTADQATFTVGTEATYTLVVSNKGPSTATDVVVTDTLPAGLSLVSIDEPSGWTCSGTAPIRCTTPSLDAGESATITLTVLVGADAVDQVTNVVEVDSEEPDANPADNRDEVTNPVTEVLGVVETPPAPAVLTTSALPYTGVRLDAARPARARSPRSRCPAPRGSASPVRRRVIVGRAAPRRRHFLGLLVVGVAVVGIGAACTSEDSSSPSDTVNFSGNGTAELVLDGDTFTFTVACETTDLAGQGTLLVSGRGSAPVEDGSATGLEVRVDVDGATGTIGANLGGDPPRGGRGDRGRRRLRRAARSALDADFLDVDTGREVGRGTLAVEGCSPG